MGRISIKCAFVIAGSSSTSVEKSATSVEKNATFFSTLGELPRVHYKHMLGICLIIYKLYAGPPTAP
jgi:hypothetical protein